MQTTKSGRSAERNSCCPQRAADRNALAAVRGGAEQKFQGSALDGVIRRTEAETLMQKGHCETHVPLEVFARNARLQFALTNSSQEPVCG